MTWPDKRFCLASNHANDRLWTGPMSSGVSRVSAQSHLDLYEKRGINDGFSLYELVPAEAMDRIRAFVAAAQEKWDASDLSDVTDEEAAIRRLAHAVATFWESFEALPDEVKQ